MVLDSGLKRKSEGRSVSVRTLAMTPSSKKAKNRRKKQNMSYYYCCAKQVSKEHLSILSSAFQEDLQPDCTSLWPNPNSSSTASPYPSN